MQKPNQKTRSVAGVAAPPAKITPYGLFLIATGLSAIVALPLWMFELAL